MLEINRNQLANCLHELGIEEGDGLLVHSAIQYLGKPVGGIAIFHEAIQEVIGKNGTIVVPTFNFAFASGEPYNMWETPAIRMGVFSEYVRKLPNARRTSHPMQSIAIIGRYADELSSLDTGSAFDPGSAFERMLELDFKLLLLGADSNSVSMFHYCEQRANVPYRYWKEFAGQVRTRKGWEMRTYRMFVRDLELNPILTLEPIVASLKSHGLWISKPLNYGQVTFCRLFDFVATTDKWLATDPWSLVVNHTIKAED